MLTSLNKLNRASRFAILISTALVIREISVRNDGLTNGPVICPFRLLFGIPCPACGTTRSICAITEGRFADAIALNPLGYLVITFAIFWALKIKTLSLFNQRLNSRFAQLTTTLQATLLLSIYAVAWIINLTRIDSAIF